MDRYGLIGFPLGHSASATFFNDKFSREGVEARYTLYPIREIEELNLLIQSEPDLLGLNVTIPYKVSVMDLLDEISDEARMAGAVNVVRIERSPIDRPKLCGYNTDVCGFRETILPFVREMRMCRADEQLRALVLGTGGAAKAASYALQTLGIQPTLVSRSPSEGRSITYADLTTTEMQTHRIVVNATPIGMYPHQDDYPNIPYQHLSPHHLCYDLIYNPPTTRFLTLSAEHGASICGGMSMFERQAIESYRIWRQ